LGWSLRRIERETGIRRETISAYLKEARVELRLPRGRRLPAKPASLAVEVTTDPESSKPASEVTTDSPAKAASDGGGVTTDSGTEPAGETARSQARDRAAALRPALANRIGTRSKSVCAEAAMPRRSNWACGHTGRQEGRRAMKVISLS